MEANHPIQLLVEAGEEGLRLDKFLCRRLPRLTRGAVRRLLERKRIHVDGEHQSKGHRLRAGQRVTVPQCSRDEHPLPQPEAKLQIIAERHDLVAINKEAGVPCHPLMPGETGTVANALAALFPECALAGHTPREGGLVHRLDTGTSGVLLAARSTAAHARLRRLFDLRQVEKQYLALVDGAPDSAGKVRGGLRPVPGARQRMEVLEDAQEGREAETVYAPLERLGPYTLVDVICHTGQRHQMRVHLALAGFPVAGDETYGGSPMPEAGGAFLHASRVRLPDEEFSAPLPQTRQQIIDHLRRKHGAR